MVTEPFDKDLEAAIAMVRQGGIQSKHPLKRLKRNLLINICWAIIIFAAFFAALFVFNDVWIRMGILLMLSFTLWATWGSIRLYVGLQPLVSAENNVKAELNRQYALFTRWMKVQQNTGLVFYPISAATGFMAGGMEGSGKSVAEFIQLPFVMIALFVSIIVLVPFCYLLAKWMFKVAFGQHVDNMKQLMDSLEN
ncbi:MAG: hypothetical protein SFW35_13580 [Chitinophagales bacterium]|nr:hypothetical protein [Chitinophagales bacterium]